MCDVSPERGGSSNYEGQQDYREPYRSGYQGDWRNNYWKESEWKDRKDGSGKEGGWSSGMEWVEVPDPRQLTANRMSSRGRKRSPGKGSSKAAVGSDDSEERSRSPGSDRATGVSPMAGRSSAQSSTATGVSITADSSEAPSSLAGDIEESVTTGKMQCSHCKEHWGKADEFVCDSVLDWQSGLSLTCCKCWLSWADNEKKTAKDFKTASKRSWRSRSNNAKQLMRVKHFNECIIKEVREDGETAKQFRKRLMDGAATLTAAFLKVFKMAGPVKQAQLVEALDAMHSERGKIAANPEYVPLMSSCGAKLDWSVSQYINQITRMMAKYYLCMIYR
jgi:hypothetical protein